jgi:CIC family chloride channel protein
MLRPPTARRLTFLTVLAAGLGAAGGAAAWALLHLIDLVTTVTLFHRLALHHPPLRDLHVGWSTYAAAIGGALAISALARWTPVIRGHGIPEAMEAVLTRDSRIAPATAVAKPMSAAIAIGTGAPFGAEGPIIVTGGALGSLLGQVVPVSPAERKILLSCGAAAGMAATFGSPLAAVVLAVELLLFEFSARALLPLITATAVAGGIHAALFGAGPLFEVPHLDYQGLTALPAFAVLGVACGVLAVTITRGLFGLETLYRRLPVSEFWHPVIGAVAFVSVGMVEPRALGVGYDVIGDVLSSRFTLGVVAAIAVAKLAAWWFALASGTSGGTLAPILLVSASFGSIMGHAIDAALPGSHVAAGAFALVAMAATFGSAARAPFAAIVFVFELTREYELVLPLMLATILADLVYNACNEHSIMTEKLHRRGLRIGRHYGVDPLTSTRVGDVMRPPRDGDTEATAVRATDPVLRAVEVMLDEQVERVPVTDASGTIVGAITAAELLRARERHRHLEARQSGLVRTWPRPLRLRDTRRGRRRSS